MSEQAAKYEVRSMVDGLGGVYEGEGELVGEYADLEAAEAEAGAGAARYVLRTADGAVRAPGVWVA